MTINVDVDPAFLLLRLRKGEKRMAFAVVNAINRTAKRIQVAERERVKEQFTVRNEKFILREAAKIKPFASVRQSRPFAEIAVGQKRRLFLSGFETGEKRVPFKGRRIAAPVVGGPARPTFQSKVPKALRFTALRLRLTPRGDPGRRVRRRSRKQIARRGVQPVRFGLLGTFLIPGVGVFQRVRGQEPKIVYVFVDPFDLPKILDFVKTAKHVADIWFREELERQIFETLARNPLP